MKHFIISVFVLFFCLQLKAQIDPKLLRNPQQSKDSTLLNMDAVYNRPFVQVGRLPVALGGYMEANNQNLIEDGVT
jgi:hypothetical protein